MRPTQQSEHVLLMKEVSGNGRKVRNHSRNVPTSTCTVPRPIPKQSKKKKKKGRKKKNGEQITDISSLRLFGSDKQHPGILNKLDRLMDKNQKQRPKDGDSPEPMPKPQSRKARRGKKPCTLDALPPPQTKKKKKSKPVEKEESAAKALGKEAGDLFDSLMGFSADLSRN